MIEARVFTNLDGKFTSWRQRFIANFSAMPEVGHVFEWYDMRCHIISVGWEIVDTVCNGIEMRLVVEFNK